MREIKFRGWDYQKKRMIYFDNLEMWNTNWLNEFEICMQYTGLKDRTGKEIYESDIVLMDFSDKNKVVVFDKQMASFRIQSHVKHNDGTFKTHGFEETESYELEIIGNIHENPDLL